MVNNKPGSRERTDCSGNYCLSRALRGWLWGAFLGSSLLFLAERSQLGLRIRVCGELFSSLSVHPRGCFSR